MKSAFWIELLLDAGKVTRDKVDPLLAEANQLVAITIASINTARSRKEQSQE